MITCIKCKAQYEAPEEMSGKTDELTCPSCHSRFKVKWKMEMELTLEEPVTEKAPEPVKTDQTNRPGVKILVAIDGEATLDIMKEVLTEAGHEVFLASTGKDALSVLEKEHPQVAYLDVALPQVLGFEICEIIKKSSQFKETIVILVSAIYDKTRYKRAPSSLYGADDYIERHHIQDSLITKLNKLLNPEDPEPSQSPLVRPAGSTVEVMDRESLSPRHRVQEVISKSEPSTEIILEPVIEPPKEAVEPRLQEVPPAVLEPINELPEEEFVASTLHPPEIGSELEIPEIPQPLQEGAPVFSPEESAKHEEAKRFARLIISDIALYNQKTIEEGIENGNIEELLKDELVEGEKLYQERVPREIRENTHYLLDSLRDLVERKMKIMKQGK